MHSPSYSFWKVDNLVIILFQFNLIFGPICFVIYIYQGCIPGGTILHVIPGITISFKVDLLIFSVGLPGQDILYKITS